MRANHVGAYTYHTQTYRLPPEPPTGTIVVPFPDAGGSYWTRDDQHPTRRWVQSKRNDHRRVTWGEVLSQAGGVVQILPDDGQPIGGIDHGEVN